MTTPDAERLAVLADNQREMNRQRRAHEITLDEWMDACHAIAEEQWRIRLAARESGW